MTISDHRAVAEALVAVSADIATSHPVDPLSMSVAMQAASVHALIYVGDQMRALVEQQQIGNVIAAFGTDGEDGLLGWEDQAAAQTYVRAHIANIVNPDPNGFPS